MMMIVFIVVILNLTNQTHTHTKIIDTKIVSYCSSICVKMILLYINHIVLRKWERLLVAIQIMSSKSVLFTINHNSSDNINKSYYYYYYFIIYRIGYDWILIFKVLSDFFFCSKVSAFIYIYYYDQYITNIWNNNNNRTL